MTARPGMHLRFDPDLGVMHVHSDEELSACRWRLGAECSSCPERVWDRGQDEDDAGRTQPITQVQRKRRAP
jgi:hypothetical protein